MLLNSPFFCLSPFRVLLCQPLSVSLPVCPPCPVPPASVCLNANHPRVSHLCPIASRCIETHLSSLPVPDCLMSLREPSGVSLVFCFFGVLTCLLIWACLCFWADLCCFNLFQIDGLNASDSLLFACIISSSFWHFYI